ncbi:hypothetical protein GDO81_000091 [Engystomops pustulosus]|uniref:Uncharacterized protein n=1 Tax=Engystomops pustulosus TaxID=76066 RepID=A0AAV7D1B0_ENGPU|nr:hypothetical protein GDO81_000091 [Engystomops pustulosus]
MTGAAGDFLPGLNLKSSEGLDIYHVRIGGSGSSGPPRTMAQANTWNQSLSGTRSSPETAAKQVGLVAAGCHQVIPQT